MYLSGFLTASKYSSKLVIIINESTIVIRAVKLSNVYRGHCLDGWPPKKTAFCCNFNTYFMASFQWTNSKINNDILKRF
jgi:hypothetical protein